MNRTILVAGATSGIGFETCKLLAQKGDRVLMVSRNAVTLKQKVSELKKVEVGEHRTFSFDFTNTEDIELFVNDNFTDEKIDGIVYCVGNGNSKKLKDLTFDSLLPCMKSNYFSFIELVRMLISKRKNKDSQFNIIAVSSLSSTHANAKYYSAYTSSKAALEGCIRVLAPELALKNCSICAVKPGYVNTPRIESDRLLHPDLENYIKKSGFQPGGIIPPKTVGKMIQFLLDCEDLSFTGAILPINAAAIS